MPLDINEILCKLDTATEDEDLIRTLRQAEGTTKDSLFRYFCQYKILHPYFEMQMLQDIKDDTNALSRQLLDSRGQQISRSPRNQIAEHSLELQSIACKWFKHVHALSDFVRKLATDRRTSEVYSNLHKEVEFMFSDEALEVIDAINTKYWHNFDVVHEYLSIAHSCIVEMGLPHVSKRGRFMLEPLISELPNYSSVGSEGQRELSPTLKYRGSI